MQSSESEYSYMFIYYCQVGEKKFCEYIKNIDLFKTFRIPKKEGNKVSPEYLDFLSNPEVYMEEFQKK